jgi:hypothetical protein
MNPTHTWNLAGKMLESPDTYHRKTTRCLLMLQRTANWYSRLDVAWVLALMLEW